MEKSIALRYEKALQNRNPEVRFRALEEIVGRTRQGEDIQPLVPALLKEKTGFQKQDFWPAGFYHNAIIALTYYFLNRGDVQGIADCMEERHPQTRFQFSDLTTYLHASCTSQEELERVEKPLEEAFAIWCRKQLQGASAERIRVGQKMAEVLKVVAERKARYTKEGDGELLAGETIPRADLPKRMYRVVRN